jgi:acetyl-CoA carboxylase biotin carboxyl carrier protein
MSRIEIESEVTGNVWKVATKVGDRVEEEDVLLILESMKMEIPVEATCAGTVTELLVSEKDSVEEDQILVIIEAA